MVSKGISRRSRIVLGKGWTGGTVIGPDSSPSGLRTDCLHDCFHAACNGASEQEYNSKVGHMLIQVIKPHVYVVMISDMPGTVPGRFAFACLS